ncbi:hypothetical protein NDU88_004484 [Pleurodeles waltl]|uniref:Uncharacterized protein n=2 Tax=Pleurodeles waltl TaxID=8319 RepID=A0AAV7L4W2_PLEWA|nr:hypothetical protein NDU88_004484 [Pleurodeles waltl]
MFGTIKSSTPLGDTDRVAVRGRIALPPPPLHLIRQHGSGRGVRGARSSLCGLTHAKWAAISTLLASHPVRICNLASSWAPGLYWRRGWSRDGGSLAERMPPLGCTERPVADHSRSLVDNISADTAFVLEHTGAPGIVLPSLAWNTKYGIGPTLSLRAIESGGSHMAWISQTLT